MHRILAGERYEPASKRRALHDFRDTPTTPGVPESLIANFPLELIHDILFKQLDTFFYKLQYGDPHELTAKLRRYLINISSVCRVWRSIVNDDAWIKCVNNSDVALEKLFNENKTKVVDFVNKNAEYITRLEFYQTKFWNNNFSDQDIIALHQKCSNLETLILFGADIKDDSYVGKDPILSVKELFLPAIRFSEKGFSAIGDCFKKLESLLYFNNLETADAVFNILKKNFTTLNTLYFYQDGQIPILNDQKNPDLQLEFPGIKSLTISSVQIGDDNGRDIVRLFPNLEYLYITTAFGVSNLSMELFKALPHLSAMDIQKYVDDGVDIQVFADDVVGNQHFF